MLNAIPLVSKLLGLAALVAILTLTVLWQAADRRADKWQSQSLKLSAQLERLAVESEERQRESARRIAEAQGRIVVVDRIAREIEKAPLEGQCKTPDAILKADL